MINLSTCQVGDLLTFTNGSVHEFESFDGAFLHTKTPRAPRINLQFDVSDKSWVTSESGEHICKTNDGNNVVSVQTAETKELYEKRRIANKALLKKLEEQLDNCDGVRFGQLLTSMGFDHDRFYEEPWNSLERIENNLCGTDAINEVVVQSLEHASESDERIEEENHIQLSKEAVDFWNVFETVLTATN